MSEVWRGEHEALGAQVAVKLLTPGGSRHEATCRQLATEARSLARLDHPGIVALYDQGRVDPETDAASGGTLTAQSPYLVMELADHGTLWELGRPRSFEALQLMLRQVLSALAHAHARGIIHRDIKPINVLVGDMAPGGLRLLLSDFGIAHHLDETTAVRTRARAAGTPSYMAPEQIRCELHNQGPWTDLYALGCLTFWLACGHPPYSQPGSTRKQILANHLFAPVPLPKSRFPLPEGMDRWIYLLLAKDPRDRFVCAADAARALESLGDRLPAPEVILDLVQEEERSEQEPWEQEAAVNQPSEEWGIFHPTPIELSGQELRMTGELPSPPPIRLPETWQPEGPLQPPAPMPGVGLGLLSLRVVPLVGRHRERDLLWSVLRSVEQSTLAQLVLLRGSSGIGKSRLAQWLIWQAQEVGAATVLRATFGRSVDPGHALTRMLQRQLRCSGLAHDRMLAQTLFALGAGPDQLAGAGQELRELHALSSHEPVDLLSLARDLTGIMAHPPGTPGRQTDGRGLAACCHEVVQRFVERLAAERTLLVWMKDVQWADEALELLQSLIVSSRDLPVLWLLGVDPEVLLQRPLESACLMRLLRHQRARALELGPLDPDEQLELLRQLVELEPELEAQVLQATAGSPRLTLGLITKWAERELLDVGPRGFRLRAGVGGGEMATAHLIDLD